MTGNIFETITIYCYCIGMTLGFSFFWEKGI